VDYRRRKIFFRRRRKLPPVKTVPVAFRGAKVWKVKFSWCFLG
jgi:hypothetical protein